MCFIVKITGAIKGIMVFSSFRIISTNNFIRINTLIRVVTFIRRNYKYIAQDLIEAHIKDLRLLRLTQSFRM